MVGLQPWEGVLGRLPKDSASVWPECSVLWVKPFLPGLLDQYIVKCLYDTAAV